MSEIMAKIYPVKWYMDAPRRTLLDELESALHNWMIELPDELRFHETGSRTPPPPHVLVLHAEYYSALLLLYRALYVPIELQLTKFLLTSSTQPSSSNVRSLFDMLYFPIDCHYPVIATKNILRSQTPCMQSASMSAKVLPQRLVPSVSLRTRIELVNMTQIFFSNHVP